MEGSASSRSISIPNGTQKIFKISPIIVNFMHTIGRPLVDRQGGCNWGGVCLGTEWLLQSGWTATLETRLIAGVFFQAMEDCHPVLSEGRHPRHRAPLVREVHRLHRTIIRSASDQTSTNAELPRAITLPFSNR